LQERWHYRARDEENPTLSPIWYLQDSDPQLKVVRRGAFFDAERGSVILDRFTTLEEAQRRVETEAKRMPMRRGRREVRTSGES